jgi:multifunctional methyltransferase subunit TRM112
MVRLITHNLLGCHVKNCNANNFPLEFKNAQVELVEAEFNPDFLRGFLPKIEWKALVDTARQVRLFTKYPVTRMAYLWAGITAWRHLAA